MKVSKTPPPCHFNPTCMGRRPAPLHRCQCPPIQSLGVRSSYNVAPLSPCCERFTTEFPAPSHLQTPSCPHIPLTTPVLCGLQDLHLTPLFHQSLART